MNKFGGAAPLATEVEVESQAQNRRSRVRASVAADQIVLIMTVALTLVAFGGSIGYQFVYDDHAQVLTNSFIHSWRFFPRYFTQHVWESIMPGVVSNYYRPVFIIWLRLNHMLFGLNPWGWHLTNILAHIGVTLSLYFLVLRLTADRLTAAFAALIFGVHPVHVEGVVWVSGVTEPLLGLLFIPSFISHLKMREQGSSARRWLGVSVFLYLVALFAKETGLMLPMLICAYEWLFWRRSESGTYSSGRLARVGTALKAAVPYLAVTPLYLVLRAIALKGISHTLSPMPLSTLMLTAPPLLWFYLKRFVWPVNMSMVYRPPYVHSPGLVNFVLPSLALAAIAFVLWAWARKPARRELGKRGGLNSRVVTFACLWVLLPLLPVLNVAVLPLNDCVHDRYLYLPSAGLAIITALVLRSIRVGRATFLGEPRSQFVLAGIVALLSVRGAILESVVWSDDLLLYYRGASISPRNPSLESNLANALAERGHYGEAITLFRQALDQRPRLWEAHYNLGLIYYKFGKLAEAESEFKSAMLIDPNKAAEFLYLGLTQLRLGRVDDAAAAIHQAVRINPDAYGVHFARGMVLKLQGDLAGALDEFQEELALNPEQDMARAQIVEIERRPRNP